MAIGDSRSLWWKFGELGRRVTGEKRRWTDEVGLAAWDEARRDVTVYQGGPLGPTKRTTAEGVTNVVNQPKVFVVVRAPSQAAASLFEGHPHFTIFPCDGVEVTPLLGPKPQP